MIPRLTDEPGARETAAAIRAGRLSPLEAVDAAIARIEALDGPINAVVVRDFDRARDVAKSLDGKSPGEDQPLFGVPMTIKEAFNVAGLPTTWGLAEHREFIAEQDAKVVAKLKRAGAIILGKTNVALRLEDMQSANPAYGRTVNPHDHARSPGGSSGGSGAALAAGMVPVEFGSDIAGSIRIPAHFCGIWGHKPTWGAIDPQGHSLPETDGHANLFNVVGPMARNAADLDLLLELALEQAQTPSGKSLPDCRFLLLTDHPLMPTDSAIVSAIEAMTSKIAQSGARVDRECALLPDLATQHEAYMAMLLTTLDPKGTRFGMGQATVPQWFAWLDQRAVFIREWEALFESYDFVLTPPMPVPAIPHSDAPLTERTYSVDGEDQPGGNVLGWTGIATYPGLPSTLLPIGTAHDLPCGMQVIGPRWRDRDCIAMAVQIGELIGA